MHPAPGPLYPEYARLTRVAVCAPTYFALRQPVNVIVERQLEIGQQVDPAGAADQHAALRAALRASGARVEEVEPDPRFPYQINVRDAGLATPAGFVLGRFRLPIRQGEERRVAELLAAVGQEPLGQPRAAFEGGDFVALDSRLGAVGLGARTESDALPELQALLGSEVELIGVPFAERFLHLDMVLNLVDERLALACPAALPPELLDRLRAAGVGLIEVSEEEVFGHGCNVLPLGPGQVLSHPRNERVNGLLRAEGFKLTVIDVTELARSGGGPRCLTLPIARQLDGG